MSQLLASGLATGFIYALVALSFIIIYNSVGAINFAQGDFVMAGGFLGVWAGTSLGLPLGLAFVVALVLMMVMGIIWQRLCYVPLRDKPFVTFAIASVGAGIAMRNLALLVFGPQPRGMSPLLGLEFIKLGGISLTSQHVVIALVTLGVLGGQYLFFNRALYGKMLRATAQDPTTARLMGIRTRHMIVLTFLISAVLSGVAGFLLVPVVFIYPDAGVPLLTKAFTATVVGGFGSIPGAVVGGLLMGLVEVLLAAFVSSKWKDVFLFIILIGVLIFAPRGIFGESVSEKV